MAFLDALPLAGAPLAACAPAFTLRSAFGFGVSPGLWTCSQIRPAATLVVLKLFTGFTPGRLFQMATNRSAGQPADQVHVSSFWLAEGVERGGGRSGGFFLGGKRRDVVLRSSIVNVFMNRSSSGLRSARSRTWITPVARQASESCSNRCRAIERAMMALGARLAAVGISMEGARRKFGRKTGGSDRCSAHPAKHRRSCQARPASATNDAAAVG